MFGGGLGSMCRIESYKLKAGSWRLEAGIPMYIPDVLFPKCFGTGGAGGAGFADFMDLNLGLKKAQKNTKLFLTMINPERSGRKRNKKEAELF